MSSGKATYLIWLIAIGFLLGGCTTDSVGPGPQYPQIGLSRDTLDFGVSGMEETLIIHNTGGGALEWFFDSYPAWLDPTASSGSVAAFSSDTVIFSIDRTLLVVGTTEAEIILTYSGGDIVLTARVQQSDSPVLGDPPETLDFGTSQDSLELVIHNAGQDTLTWTISISDSLFTASQYNGYTTQQTSVWIRLDWENAPQGDIQSDLEINSNGGSAQVALLAVREEPEGQWLSYCGDADGYYPAYPEDYFFMVRFDRPQGWAGFKVSRVRMQLHTLAAAYDDIILLCWNTMEDQGYLWPDLYDLRYQTGDLNPDQGWNQWLVDWPLDLASFCVGYYQYDWTPDINPDPYYDVSNPLGRSFIAWESSPNWFILDIKWDWEWCLEVYVEPISTAAGFGAGGVWLQPEIISADVPYGRPIPGLSRGLNYNDERFVKPDLR